MKPTKIFIKFHIVYFFVERQDLFEGDINIRELIEAQENEMDFGMVMGARRFGRWPNGVMPYVISSTIG